MKRPQLEDLVKQADRLQGEVGEPEDQKTLQEKGEEEGSIVFTARFKGKLCRSCFNSLIVQEFPHRQPSGRMRPLKDFIPPFE